MTHYFTRAVVNKHAPEHTLRPLLDPKDASAAMDAHRRLIWTLFPGRHAKRDFLWRADGNGKFLIISARKPHPTRLFRPIDFKPYKPVLAAGDRLAFVLRANATKDRRSSPGENTVTGTKRRPRRNRRVDIVMHAMHELGLKGGSRGSDSRSSRRMQVAEEAAQSWLARQGKLRGFEIGMLAVEDYQALSLKRSKGKAAKLGVLDLKGILTVSEPEEFTNLLYAGLGRAKAFGCGLMLVRRA
ncbi:MAG: type I-E CRISPR-associated protein Cas6/Cse3/CasE [Rhodobacteraceae bacterium]|nr:type I-E CRISPR-associated protein Cas6/Cse3/CasE [Paracoccaceae bacterium]